MARANLVPHGSLCCPHSFADIAYMLVESNVEIASVGRRSRFLKSVYSSSLARSTHRKFLQYGRVQ
jgi:hypothetical protein